MGCGLVVGWLSNSRRSFFEKKNIFSVFPLLVLLGFDTCVHVDVVFMDAFGQSDLHANPSIGGSDGPNLGRKRVRADPRRSGF